MNFVLNVQNILSNQNYLIDILWTKTKKTLHFSIFINGFKKVVMFWKWILYLYYGVSSELWFCMLSVKNSSPYDWYFLSCDENIKSILS